MPDQEITHRFQRALLFPFVNWDAYTEPVVGDPVELIVRWENKETELRDKNGNVFSVDAVVHVHQDVTENSRMWLAPDSTYSALEQWSGTGSGGNDDTVMEVVVFNKTPDIRHRAWRRTVGLKRFRDEPTQ